jgi:hypothetical protein
LKRDLSHRESLALAIAAPPLFEKLRSVVEEGLATKFLPEGERVAKCWDQ